MVVQSLSWQLRAQGGTHPKPGYHRAYSHTTHSHQGWDNVDMPMYFTIDLWDVGGNGSLRRKASQTWGEYAISTQTVALDGIDLFFHHYNKMTLKEMILHKMTLLEDLLYGFY